jgi:hypothetical protein
MRKLVFQCLDANGTSKKQILSLGAGFDTLFFQLKVISEGLLETEKALNLALLVVICARLW